MLAEPQPDAARRAELGKAGKDGADGEAELHVLRARLNGGIRNKAARGELRRGLPIGFVWGEEDGEILIHPDEAVAHGSWRLSTRAKVYR
ncbi:hypothetical protein [Mesorhizobium sp.]|uniref:hypothetical protein n=1 Tax=Mesorhizobium sp. TaxID=1871066 RepID=UPI0025FB9D80|nr:hypothetical protein [Mesorhizobium sp.]